MEKLEVLLPKHRQKVIGLRALEHLRTLEHAENLRDLRTLDAREKRDITDPVLVEQEREGIRARRTLVDLFSHQENPVLFHRQIEALDFLP